MVTTRKGAGKRPGRGIDALGAVFDDDRAVANAGLVLPATLAGRLGLEALCDTTLDLGEREGAAQPGRKVMSIVHAMLLGADSIDDCAILRNGRANTARGAERFIVELVGRVRRVGATGPLTRRADSGFWSSKVINACRRHKIRFSVAVRGTAPIRWAIAAIPEGD